MKIIKKFTLLEKNTTTTTTAQTTTTTTMINGITSSKAYELIRDTYKGQYSFFGHTNLSLLIFTHVCACTYKVEILNVLAFLSNKMYYYFFSFM